MLNDLAEENARLRAQLSDLLVQARRNQHILRRHQLFDLLFIAASSFRELIESILDKFKDASGLDFVTLSLIDPQYEIRRILIDLDIDCDAFPNLIFLQNEAALGSLYRQLHAPALGHYHPRLHEKLFHKQALTPASVAIAPMIRNNHFIGTLNLGSLDKMRFSPNMATDFIERQASIIAICVENVINNERLKHLGLTDPLTGVNNRRYVERRLQEEIGRTQRQGYALSCLYIDIDHFKQINDQIGHQAGDDVLRSIATRIKSELRSNDAFARFGGEEFLALLIDTKQADALQVAERIRASIANQRLILKTGGTLQVTVSIGVAELGHPDRNAPIDMVAQQFIARADHALYQAKTGGRNKVLAMREPSDNPSLCEYFALEELRKT